MTSREVLRELQKLGTEQNRKIYRRHGAGDKVYGVSWANLGVLKKKIRVDHDLALELWASGNHEARLLATMIADPARLDARVLDAWVKQLDNNPMADAFADLASKTSLAWKKMQAWTGASGEWVGRAGWRILTHLANPESQIADAEFDPYLRIIEREIHSRKNYVRGAMNMALVSIGVRNEALRKRALEVAAKIGKVEVDHGETGCKTPDAAAYIEKTMARRAGKKKTAASKAKAAHG